MIAYQTLDGPAHPNYASCESRRQSFDLLPSTCKRLINPAGYAKAGFFFAGLHNVVCFYCGLTLERVRPTDDPWIEHLLRNSQCTYARLNRFVADEIAPVQWSPDSTISLKENYENGE
jgi:hypothetical protein